MKTAVAKRMVLRTVLAALFLNYGAGAFAAHGPPGSHLAVAGPVDPANGYPMWYQDSTGLTLELCLNINADLLCGLDPELELPNPAAPVSFPDNFPGEAFWWSAGTGMKTPDGRRALLVLALEAAFFPEVIARENEIAFGRVRFRIDAPQAGTYTVTHPYGVDTLVAAEAGERLFVTEDIGADVPRGFGGALKSRVDPFLTVVPDEACPAPPPGYVGDAVSECRVTGSPYGTNFFRIEGPGIAGNPAQNEFPCPDEPASPDCIQTDRFAVMGKIATRYGAGVSRATYTRGPWDPGIEVFAFTRAPDPAPANPLQPPIPEQSLEVSIGGLPIPMASDGTGKYFTFIEGDFDPSTIVVSVTNATPNSPASAAETPTLHDVVTIREAYFFRTTPPETLEIVAASSDEVSGATLTAYDADGKKLGEGAPGSGALSLVLAGVKVPPSQVTVKSSLGGSATQLIDIGFCERAGNSQRCVPPLPR